MCNSSHFGSQLLKNLEIIVKYCFIKRPDFAQWLEMLTESNTDVFTHGLLFTRH